MPTQMRYAFFHAPSKTFVEAQLGTMRVLRIAGTTVTRVGEDVHIHMNSPVAMSRTGVVSYGDAYGKLGFVDVTGKALREWKIEPGDAITPDGKRAWGWEGGVFSVAVKGKLDRKTVWNGVGQAPRLVNPYKVGAKPGEQQVKGLSFPELAIADDGKHWAAIDPDKVVLGVGARTVGVWFEKTFSYPRRYSFDLKRKRLFLAGQQGVTALAFDGRVAAAVGKLEARSAPVLVGKELVVVRKVEGESYGPCDYEVVRLDPATLKLLGPVAGVPKRREADDAESAIVPLGGDAFAWSIGDAPVMIVGLEVEPSELATTPSQTTMQLDAPKNATPAQLEAKAILEHLITDYKFGALLTAGAFAPWADVVCAWPDDRIARLQDVGSREWWQISEGASDATVDALVKLVEAGGPQREARFRLLCGVDSDHALDAIGPLAKKDLLSIAVDCNFAIEGRKAIRRFAPGGFAVVAGRKATKGVDYLRDPETLLADPTGATCKAAPFHILGVDLAALSGKPLAKSKLKTQHLFESGCEECDEWSWDFDFKPAGNKLARVAPKTAKKRCEGSTTKPERKKKLALVPLADSERDTCGRVGGRPYWVQHPAVPGCFQCGLPMFFVAQANMYSVMSNLPSGTTFSFHCERCSVISQVLQCT